VFAFKKRFCLSSVHTFVLPLFLNNLAAPYPLLLTAQTPPPENLVSVVELEALRAVTSTVVWDVTSFSPVQVQCRVRATCCLHLQGGRLTQVANFALYFLLGIFFEMKVVRSSETSVDFCRAAHPRR
jgi:hypothetical protein